MSSNIKNIAIIPARSGSKGLKDKNILLLNGIPLLAYSIIAAKKTGLFDEIMVSTDSEHYADIAIQYGASVPFLRSDKQSSDTADSWSVVEEVLLSYQKMGREFDTVTLLQPTSPLRTEADIIGGYNLFIEKSADAVTSVCEVDHSPLWCMNLPGNLSLQAFRKNMQEKPRQELDKFFRINGALYIRKIKYLGSRIVILSQNEYAYIMDRRNSVDIDVKEDFEFAEFLVKIKEKL